MGKSDWNGMKCTRNKENAEVRNAEMAWSDMRQLLKEGMQGRR